LYHLLAGGPPFRAFSSPYQKLKAHAEAPVPPLGSRRPDVPELLARALFGCWLSACRKRVLPVVQEHNHLLIFPKTYEGLEQSPNIVYTGAVPNQFILPAVRWAFRSLGNRRFFLVGLDQVSARAANAIIRDEVTALGGEIVGEEYLLPSSTVVASAMRRIVQSTPDTILNTFAGDRNVPFCRALRAAGVTPDRVPMIHFTMSEIELQSLSARETTGDYAAWNYFQSLDLPENQAFVKRFRAASRRRCDPGLTCESSSRVRWGLETRSR
jgi:urea transport system substrate-binding protein